MTDQELNGRLKSLPSRGKKVMPMNGSPVTFAELQALEKAQAIAHESLALADKFQMLTRNILASDISDIPGALAALADEYATLVASTMSVSVKKDGKKYVITLAPSERTKALLDTLSKPKPAVNTFFDKQEIQNPFFNGNGSKRK